MRVLLLSLVIGISSLFAAVNPGACSPAGSRDVVINQVFNSNGGTRAQDYVELHVNAPSVDLTGWTISIGKNNSIDATISVPLGHKNGTGVALGASAVAGTFIVFNEQAFGFSISNNNGEILLKDGSGNVVHYLAYYQGAAPDYWDHSGLEDCKTILPGYNLNSGSNPGICSKPDGDEPRGGGWITACESSLGYSNTGLMCSDVFGNAVGTIPGGEVWTDGNLYNTDDGLLYTGNLGGNNIATGCDGSSCAEGGSSIPLTMPSNSSTTNASGSTVLPTGTDTYYRTYTNFNSGDTISVNGAGTARMHIRQNGMIINGKINENGHPSRLIMYVKGNVTLNGDAVVNAILYVEGDVTVNGIVKGAITASGKITINGSGKVYYDQGAVDQADFDGACANTGFTGPTLHYTFSDCTVGQPVAALMDVSGNGNHATAYGNPLCVDTGNGGKGVRFNTDAAGNSFQLKNQYGKTNANFSFTYDEGYTVFARLRFNWSPKRIWAMFFGMKGGDSCNNNGAHWLINTRSSGDCGNLGKGVTQFGPFCGPQNRFDLTNYAGKDIALATVYYSSNKKLITYLDGVKVAEDTAATHPVSGNAPVYIAQPWSSCSQDSYFSGIYDELRIYPRALSEGEIMGLFSSPINAADNSPPTSANRRIGTKIAGKAFSLYVAGLNDDRDALQDFTKSDVKARVVEASACPSFDNGLSDWSDPLKLHGAGNPTSVSFLVEKPVKDAKIQFEWDDDGVTKRDCSFDNFSIRPAALAPYSLSAIAGETVRITENSLRAINENGTTVSNYASQLRGAEIIFNHAIAQGCSAQNIPQLVQDINLTYRNGAGDLNATFLEVGEFNLTVADETWTAADQMAECVLFSGSNIPDTNKLVGCNIEGNLTVKVSPYEFRIGATSLTPEEHWHYMADRYEDRRSQSSIAGIVEARNKFGKTTTNYEKGCLAHDLNLTLALSRSAGAEIEDLLLSSSSLTWDENNIATGLSGYKETNLTIPASHFVDGNASFDLNISITRDATPKEPVILKLHEMRPSSSENDLMSTAMQGWSAVQNLTSYFGRIHAPDISTAKNSALLNVYAEAYCTSNCGATDLMRASVDSQDWWLVTTDSNTEVNLTSTLVATGDDLVIEGGAAVSQPLVFSGTRAHTAVVHLNVPAYLWYRPFAKPYRKVQAGDEGSRKGCYEHPCVFIEFLEGGATGFGGIGDSPGKRRFIDDANETRQPQRVGW